MPDAVLEPDTSDLAVLEPEPATESLGASMLNAGEWIDAAKKFLPSHILNAILGQPPETPFVPESISKPLIYAAKSSAGDIAGMLPGATPGVRKVAEGAGEGLADTALGFVNPDAIVGGAAIKGGGMLAQAAKAAFASQMLSQAPEAYKKAVQAMKYGDEAAIAKAGVDLATATGLPLSIIHSELASPSNVAHLEPETETPKGTENENVRTPESVPVQAGKPEGTAAEETPVVPSEVQSRGRSTQEAVLEPEGEQNASDIASPASVSQPEIRPQVGQETPLRQPGETAGTSPQAVSEPRRGDAQPPAPEVDVAPAAPASPEAKPTPEPAGKGKFTFKGKVYETIDDIDLDKTLTDAQKVKAAAAFKKAKGIQSSEEAATPEVRTIPLTPGPGAATRPGATIETDIGGRESNIAPLEQLADAVAKFPEQKGSFKEKLGQWMDSVGVPVKDFFTRSYIAAKAVPAWIKEKATTLPEITDLDRRVGVWNGDEFVGGQAARQFAGNVQKVFKDRSKLRALSNWIDAEGDKALLQQRAEATKNPVLKQSYLDAANFGDDEARLASEVKNYHEDMLAWGQREGVLEDGLDKYLHRYYRESDPVLQKKLEALRYLRFSKDFAGFKKRFYDTDFDAEQAGLTPEKDAAKRILAYDYGFRQALTAREFVKRSFDAEKAVAKDGRPELDVAGGGTTLGADEGKTMTLVKPKFRADSGKPEDYRGDYVRFDHPAFQRYKFATTDSAGKPILVQGDILVHPDFAKKYQALFEKSWWGKGPIRRTVVGTSGFVKQTMLQGPFHLVQITLGGVEHRINPFKLMDLVPNDPAQRRMAEAGLYEGDQGASYATEGVSGGGLLDKIPVAGEYLQASKDWLFRDYIPRWKMTLALAIEKRGMENYAADIKAGKVTPEQITRMAARQSAAVFGGQNQRAIFRSKTFQDTLRVLFLAPDFGEERLRQVLQATGKYGKEQRTALLFGAVGLAVVAKSVEKELTGQMRFDRPFTVTYKGKEYGLRTPASDIYHFVTDPLGYVRNRLNPVITRPLLEGLTGRDYFGRKRSPWEQVKDEATTIVPIPLRGAITKSQHLWESFLNSTGITEHRDTTTEDVYKLAQNWKDKNHVATVPDEEVYDPDKDVYRDIRAAAREGDVKSVANEIDALTAKKLTTPSGKPINRAAIAEHFQRSSTAPWTGSKESDKKFMASLSASDQKKVLDAEKDRKDTAAVVFKVAPPKPKLPAWAKPPPLR
jgi:hypothetical protein